jgi:ribosomal protein L11 methyltransferase
MEQEVKQNSRWIDAGTGTGVLAILAEKLGASYIYAFDNDHWSIENAQENAEINKCKHIELVLSEIDKLQMPQVDGIAANINLHIILEFLPAFYKSLQTSKGVLLVSGILVYHKDDVIQPALDLGFELEEVKQDDEWVGIKFRIKG